MEERVQKLMARAGLGSRRENEKLIAAGRVRVNGRVIRLGAKADADRDVIAVDGRPIDLESQTYVYVALNKPRGVISSLQDELDQERRTVRDLVDLPGHLYPVGRLDKQSTGLMLMTNDGELAHKLTHPRYEHEKTYVVVVEGKVSLEELERWQKGVWLGKKKTAPAKVRIVKQNASLTQLEIVMREGRKRQIRRVASMLGHPVLQLEREKIGPLTLGTLEPGQWRHLSPEEVSLLQSAAKSGKTQRHRRSAKHRKTKGRGQKQKRS